MVSSVTERAIAATCISTLVRRGNVRVGHSPGIERGVRVKIKKLVARVGIAAIALGMAGATAVPASAANNIKPFGTQETLNDYGTGAPMIGYTVMALSPSSDPVPHNGQLYAATVKVEGLGGWATPLVPLFNARAESGANYRVIGGNVPRGTARWPDDRHALLRCRGRHPQQRRLQRRSPGSAGLGARSSRGRYQYLWQRRPQCPRRVHRDHRRATC